MQMVEAHNYVPGNAGVIFYTDIVLPIFGLVLFWLLRQPSRAPAYAR